MTIRGWLAPWLVIWICLFLTSGARAQSIGGAIVGQVKDSSGSSVEAALVQITDRGTGGSRVVSTDHAGRFAALEIPPGMYDVLVLKGGFNAARRTGIRLGVSQVAQIAEIDLTVSPVGMEKVEEKTAEISLPETDTPALSARFGELQIRELPLVNRDVNALALLAAGVVNARTFSFASTLVPFAVSGSRGRNNNFIIDSVDNNEPLFGGAAAQFTNTDLFSEFRIYTSVFKAEYGRNSGSVVNILTAQGSNVWHGTAFWFAQRDALNSMNRVEQTAGLNQPAPFQQDVSGATLGGPLKKNSTWFFASYQWDGIRGDLSALYPEVATLPTLSGLNALSSMPQGPTIQALVADPTVSVLPIANTPCASFVAGLPPANPCTISGPPNNGILVNGAPVEFGSYLVPGAGAFNSRDHQASFRVDHRLGKADEVSGRYLVDDLRTPRNAGSTPLEVGFFDPGLFPAYGDILEQRTQNGGFFWTHAWPRALHELRISVSRIGSESGSLDSSQRARELLPSATVSDTFAQQAASGGTAAGTSQLLFDFPAAGSLFTIGRDTRPTENHTTLAQIQDNLSLAIGRHSVKLGVNLVRTQSNLRAVPSDLGNYFYSASTDPTTGKPNFSGFQNFTQNSPQFPGEIAVETFPNLGGRGGEILPLREFSQFYFLQDDIRLGRQLTISLGMRYENFGQPINRIAELNPGFGPKIERDNLDFGPRIGFARSIGAHAVLRGGYGMYYDPTVFNVALLAWQSGPLAPFVSGTPTNVYPQPPFVPSDALRRVSDCDSLGIAANQADTSLPTFVDCNAQDRIARNLKQPRTHNFALSLEYELSGDLLLQVAYTGTIGTSLPQRVSSNPRTGYAPCVTLPCTYLPRLTPNRGDIFTVTNGAHSTYHGLQLTGTKRAAREGLFRALSLSATYTWSHWIDNASEIFGPEVRRVRDFKFLRKNAAPIEVITPFAEDSASTTSGERGDSSYDRRNRIALSFVWSFPSLSSNSMRWLFGGWELSGIFTEQSGAPFSPLNSFGACTDANGDGNLTNDRPSIGDPRAPLNRVALVKDPNCLDLTQGYVDVFGNPIDPTTAHFVQVPLAARTGSSFTAGGATFIAGNAGRNILRGPSSSQLDLSVHKNLHLTEGLTVQFRMEAFDVLNSQNAGNAIGNPFIVDTEAAPALAFGSVLPAVTPARATGIIPENSIDAFDAVTHQALFLSRRFMNTSSRQLQAGVKLVF
jgi:hypothetical protein